MKYHYHILIDSPSYPYKNSKLSYPLCHHHIHNITIISSSYPWYPISHYIATPKKIEKSIISILVGFYFPNFLGITTVTTVSGSFPSHGVPQIIQSSWTRTERWNILKPMVTTWDPPWPEKNMYHYIGMGQNLYAYICNIYIYIYLYIEKKEILGNKLSFTSVFRYLWYNGLDEDSHVKNMNKITI